MKLSVPITVSGRVLEPAAKAELFAIASLGTSIVKIGTAGRDGRFSVKVPGFQFTTKTMGAIWGRESVIIARCPGAGIEWQELKTPRGGKPCRVNIRLPEEVPIRGRILSREGQPVAGLEVSLIAT